MKKKKQFTTVTIRHKAISGGRHSVYLDYYPPVPNPKTGKLVRREYLGLYLFDKPRTELDKEHNRSVKELSKNLCATRQIAIQNDFYGFRPSKEDTTLLADYYKSMAAKRSGSNSDNWKSSIYYLESFFNEGTKLSDLNATICNDYRSYLLKAPSQRKVKANRPTVLISRNTAVSYFNKFKAMLKQAYKDELIKKDLNVQIPSIKPAETHRQFLTHEELQKLADTPCPHPLLRQAALFSALTGLRFSDIQKLTWSEIHHAQADQYYLQFRQKKTEGAEVLPVSEDAIGLLGERGKPSDKVFKGLQYSAYTNKLLSDWVKQAGITKHITFHCFRHTYATLQLSLGTEIYTVSKLLGHRELKTTQLYAKVIDKTKQEAANKIKLKL